MKLESIKVTADNVLILPSGERESNGFIMPKSYDIPNNFGTVIEVGSHIKNNKNNDYLNLKKGDTVYYMQGAGVPIEIENAKYVVMPYAKILLTAVEEEMSDSEHF